jgi:hypothetical protein
VNLLQTRYVRHQRTRFELTQRVELERLDEEARCDGIFPLITNELALSERVMPIDWPLS